MNTQSIAVSTVDGTLSFLSPDLTDQLLDAYHTSLIWAQAAARVTSTNPSSEPYWHTFREELQKIGWRLTGAAGSCDTSVPAAKMLAEALLTIIASRWPSRAQPPTPNSIFQALHAIAQQKDDPDSADLRRLLAFWWNNTKIDGNHIIAGFGSPYPSKSPASLSKPSVSARPMILKIDVAGLQSTERSQGKVDWTDWKSLFTQIKPSSPLVIDIREEVFDLDITKYNSVAPDIRTRIKGKENNHLMRASLPLL